MTNGKIPLNRGYIKRRYAEIRWGYAQVGFFIGLSNFMILSYNFTGIKDIIRMEYFIPIVGIIFAILFTSIGAYFRKNQMSLEHDLGFERAPTTARMFRIILEGLKPTDEVIKEIQYLKRIEAGKV